MPSPDTSRLDGKGSAGGMVREPRQPSLAAHRRQPPARSPAQSSAAGSAPSPAGARHRASAPGCGEAARAEPRSARPKPRPRKMASRPAPRARPPPFWNLPAAEPHARTDARRPPREEGRRRFAIYGHGRKYLRHGVGS